ncbi:1,2-phenylacetyl-CoA epoxidase subunit PaaD [Specibacter cremeus]|uniref:1,2-phenylacetyl-CoA epoxidase subunit PaaD n=1 Tax=Specibacter cremeus TaxID=1629051 RepID=UPI00197B6942|nr:1,2-phenylacetyl-CoA epoxidase subunit PaaD [Specibacter cremeus]
MTAVLSEVDEVAWAVASTVADPEIPVLSIADLGILRDVHTYDDGGPLPAVSVTITPTYSGCPAMDAIREDLGHAFTAAGYGTVGVNMVLAPAWTTDWMTADGKAKLAEYGIAAPAARAGGKVTLALSVKCPRCDSLNTREITRFGSTSCKALYTCRDCLEPFDYFKVH